LSGAQEEEAQKDGTEADYENANAGASAVGLDWETGCYCRSRTSSIAARLPRSTLTTLWIGLNPVSVISTM